MPDDNGKLTAEDKQKFRTWLGRFSPGGDAVCPVCQNTHWQFGEHIVQPVTLGPNRSVMLGGISYPQVMLISPCGYTMFFNAVVVGLFPQAPPPSEEPKT